MASHSQDVVPKFDFCEAHGLSVSKRIRKCVREARQILRMNGYQKLCDYPCIPECGASSTELRELESDLGVSAPNEYRAFLEQHRYIKLDDGLEIGGFDNEGVYVTEQPWVSTKHRNGVKYLVFANYWRYADGDQLMFDLSQKSAPVIAYLHEHGPLFEMYAPSFSLALWRLTHEPFN